MAEFIIDDRFMSDSEFAQVNANRFEAECARCRNYAPCYIGDAGNIQLVAHDPQTGDTKGYEGTGCKGRLIPEKANFPELFVHM